MMIRYVSLLFMLVRESTTCRSDRQFLVLMCTTGNRAISSIQYMMYWAEMHHHFFELCLSHQSFPSLALMVTVFVTTDLLQNSRTGECLVLRLQSVSCFDLNT